MNTESDGSSPVNQTDQKQLNTGRGYGSRISIAVALLALVLSGITIWFVQNIGEGIGTQDREYAKLEDKLTKFEKNAGALYESQEGMRKELEEIREQQRRINVSIAALYKNQSTENLDWALAEIEHLMVIAIHNITLQHNSATALAALHSADARLEKLGDPDLLSVREQLAADMNALQSVKSVDITGLSLYLADLTGRAGSLPLNDQPVSKLPEMQMDNLNSENKSGFGKLAHEIWQELKSLVVITHSGTGSRALLLPEEQYFLYQNLRLQLEAARVAVLQRDTASFHACVEIILGWLGDYFNKSDTGINNIIQSLQKMLKLELDPELPDVSSSLETLRVYIKDRAGTPVSPDGTEPAS